MAQPKVLIVDDDAAMRHLLCHTLGNGAYQLLEANDGPQTLGIVNQELPDLILLDVMMPGMDGMAVLRTLKEQEHTRHIPVIMVTALTEEEHVTRSLEEGALDHIGKPFSPPIMRARVKAALRPRFSQVHETPRVPTKRARIIGFLGAKGGVGTTTAVVNTALAILSSKRSVIVAELRPHPGSLARHLGVPSRPNLQPLLESQGGDDWAGSLAKCLLLHPTGLRLLLAPPTFDDRRELTAQQSQDIVKTLANQADVVLLDLPFPPTTATRAALSCCDFIILTVAVEPACVTSSQTLFETLLRWDFPGESIAALLIVHHVLDCPTTTAGAARKELKCRIVGLIPAAPGQCQLAIDKGRPLMFTAPNHLATTGFAELSQRLLAEQVQVMTF